MFFSEQTIEQTIETPVMITIDSEALGFAIIFQQHEAADNFSLLPTWIAYDPSMDWVIT